MNINQEPMIGMPNPFVRGRYDTFNDGMEAMEQARFHLAKILPTNPQAYATAARGMTKEFGLANYFDGHTYDLIVKTAFEPSMPPRVHIRDKKDDPLIGCTLEDSSKEERL